MFGIYSQSGLLKCTKHAKEAIFCVSLPGFKTFVYSILRLSQDQIVIVDVLERISKEVIINENSL